MQASTAKLISRKAAANKFNSDLPAYVNRKATHASCLRPPVAAPISIGKVIHGLGGRGYEEAVSLSTPHPNPLSDPCLSVFICLHPGLVPGRGSPHFLYKSTTNPPKCKVKRTVGLDRVRALCRKKVEQVL